GENFQLDRLIAIGQVFQHQLAAVHFERSASAVDHDTRQVQLIAIQTQRLCRHFSVAADAHLVEYAGFGWVEVECQVDGIDPPSRCLVVSPLNGCGLSFTQHVIFLSTPCLSEASMNTSKSPSSTFWVAETSTLVRKSLMRLLSST